MTDFEWRRVVELLAENWPHQLHSDTALGKFRRDLDRFPVEQVLVAIETLYRDGRDFPPTGGHVLGRLVDLTIDPPPFHEALRTIRRALRKPADLIVADDSERGWHYSDERYVFLDREAPMLAGFLRTIGIDQVQLEDGGDEARLRNKYERFVGDARESLLYGGLPPAGLRKLERVVDGEVVELERDARPEPRVIAAPDGGVRRIERGPEQPRRMGFDAVASRGREAG
jgi:hypothetical protein